MKRKQHSSVEKKIRKGQKIAVSDLLSFAIKLHKEGRLNEAERNYRIILQALPDQPDACHYMGLLLHQRGQSNEGIELVRRAIRLSPDYADAYNNLGNIYKETGDLERAGEAYRKVIELVPGHGAAFNNLGVVLRSKGEYEEAVMKLLKATELNPDNAVFFQNLGNAYRKNGDFKKSAEALRRSIALLPYQSDAYSNLWRTLYVAREFEEASGVLRQWLEFDPDNPIALHYLAAHTGEGEIPNRASNGYVRQTFDKFAGTFDTVLKRLEYRAPELVATAVGRVYTQACGNLIILDAGCGTGLCGPLLHPYAARLVGVDLSSKMISKAEGREVYGELIEAELVGYIEKQCSLFDLIVSADTLVYFGDLRPLAEAAKKALRSGGHLIFTVEKGEPGNNYKLNIHGRYSHARDYIESLLTCAGFRILALTEETLRKEAGESVVGLLVSAVS